MNAGIALLHSPITPAAQQFAVKGKQRRAHRHPALVKTQASFFKGHCKHATVRLKIGQ
jgi:hypothetical protein